MNRKAMLLLSLLFGVLSACSRDEAQRACSKQYSRDPEIAACVVGAHFVGPGYSEIRGADGECMKRYDIHSIPQDAPDWIDRASQMADRYNACHFGAAGHLVMSGTQGAGSISSEGCVVVVGRGGVTGCRPN